MFELIHMNGRIYDPEITRFLSPDPFIQDPYNIFNYNRYSYCLNNPLKYTDPSGYNFIRNLIQRIKKWFEGERSNNNNENYEEDQGGGWMPVGSGFSYYPTISFIGGVPLITGLEINGGTFQDVVVQDNRNYFNLPGFSYRNPSFTFSDPPAWDGVFTVNELNTAIQYGVNEANKLYELYKSDTKLGGATWCNKGVYFAFYKLTNNKT